MNSKEILMILISNIAIIGICALIMHIKSKQNQKIKTEKELLSDIIKISFEKSTLDKGIDEIIYRITKIYSVKYVTVLKHSKIIDCMEVISSNVPDKYIEKISDYSNKIFKEKIQGYNAYIEKPKGGRYLLYPSADDRFIKYLYYIPLHINKELIGSILIEDVTMRSLVNIKKEFFSLIVNNVSFTIRNLFFTEQIKKSANTDGLTGVYNKKFMYEHLHNQIEKAKDDKTSFCLAILDIDHFKKFNDDYGHQHGDIVLKKVTEFFVSQLREEDFIYRFGGEEFIIYLPLTSTKLAYDRMNNLREKLSNLDIRLEDTNELTPVKISMGIAKYPEDTIVLDELIKMADTALYKSKNTGRNRVTVYYHEMV